MIRYRTKLLGTTLTAGLLASAVAMHGQFQQSQEGEGQRQAPPQEQQRGQNQGEITFPGQEKEERPSGQDPAARMEELRKDYEEKSERLGEIHREAMKDEDLIETIEEYEALVHKKILEVAPDLEDEVKENAKLIENIREAGDTQDMGTDELEEYREMITRQQELRQRLGPVENEIQTDDEVQEARTDLHDDLFAKMEEIEPKTEEMLEERIALVQEINEIQQQIMQQQQPEGQAPGGQQPGAQQRPPQGQQRPPQGGQQQQPQGGQQQAPQQGERPATPPPAPQQ